MRRPFVRRPAGRSATWRSPLERNGQSLTRRRGIDNGIWVHLHSEGQVSGGFMKTALLAAPLLTITLAAPLAAASPQGSPRTVQLITMGVPAPPRLPAATGSDGTDRPDTPAVDEGAPLAEARAAALPASFSVHDLSRKWVQFQMAQTYGQVAPARPRRSTCRLPGGAASCGRARRFCRADAGGDTRPCVDARRTGLCQRRNPIHGRMLCRRLSAGWFPQRPGGDPAGGLLRDDERDRVPIWHPGRPFRRHDHPRKPLQ